ncbi:MAG: hypothetical protein ACP5KJ_04085 [Candidatus Micrarchaeia archaeon]
MLSETIYKRMISDEEFLRQAETTYALQLECNSSDDKNMLNRAYSELHRIAFELSVIYSPRVLSKQVMVGDFMVSLMTASKIGKVYFSQFFERMKNADTKKTGIKRIDKLEGSIHKIMKILDEIESSVEGSLKEYAYNGKEPAHKFMLEQNKRMLNVRRTYFRIINKVREMEKHIDFTGSDYECYEPLLKLLQASVRSNTKVMGIGGTNNISEVAHPDAIIYSNTKKKKMYVDKDNTNFILKYSIPNSMVKKLSSRRELRRIKIE